jgi:hypothetical protein
MGDKPGWSPIYLACKCGHEWDDWQPYNVPVETWCTHVRTYHCPHCGKRGRNILLRTKPIATAPALGFAVTEAGDG